MPRESRDAFRLMEEAGVLPHELATRLMRMVGFPNVAVHDYQNLDLDVVESIVRNDLGDFLAFTRILLQS